MKSTIPEAAFPDFEEALSPLGRSLRNARQARGLALAEAAELRHGSPLIPTSVWSLRILGWLLARGH